MSALDTQVAGEHYKKYKIQPMEYSMANGLDACQHTAIKYITRFRDKGGIEDLEKAKHCIDMLIEFERKERAKVEPCENWTMAAPPLGPLPPNLPEGWTDIREPRAPWAIGVQLELLMTNGQVQGPVSYEKGMLFPDVMAWRFGVPKIPTPSPITIPECLRPQKPRFCSELACTNSPYADSDKCAYHHFDGR